MTFNSFAFVYFFCVVLGVSRVITSWNARKFFLLGASYFFYALWNPPFIFLLFFSTAADWFLAKRIAISASEKSRKALVGASVFINLGLLGYFKYADFFLSSFSGLLHISGLPWTLPPLNIILPVGISFYTFQTLSYTFDVYRGKITPSRSFIDYALYVSFFPQLVAGPIVRAEEFLPQCAQKRTASGSDISWGVSLLVMGLFNKVVISDTLMRPSAHKMFSADSPSVTDVWAGTFAYSVRIFSDFSGYSMCAVGAALCLGFRIPWNFHFPYAAVGFSDFWKRWHITLSQWLRDYVYIPLGGGRRGLIRTFMCLMITMFLGGLWHGAGWTFVIWGLVHGLLLAFQHMAKQVLPPVTQKRLRIVSFITALFTFFAVSAAWIFFRARDMDQAFGLLKAIFLVGEKNTPNVLSAMNYCTVTVVASLTFLFHWFMRNKNLRDAFYVLPEWVRSMILALMIYFMAMSVGGVSNDFIYFQF